MPVAVDGCAHSTENLFAVVEDLMEKFEEKLTVLVALFLQTREQKSTVHRKSEAIGPRYVSWKEGGFNDVSK